MDKVTDNILRWNDDKRVYSGPGLMDLQVNGVRGIDFNNPDLPISDILKAVKFLLTKGVTTFFPTFVTNSDEKVLSMIHNLIRASDTYPLVKEVVGGIHLEGPFISPQEGARGAHNLQYVKPPDWNLLERLQEAARGEIKLITLAPEWEGAPDFIEKCKRNNILVSIGHTLADTIQIKRAVEAGAILSTHLGNGAPIMLKRHPNMIWDQLADSRLFAAIITDGHHIPDSFIRVVMKVKGEKTILVSDSVLFADMPPGEYESTIGGKVILDAEDRLTLKGGGGLLAGAAKNLLEDIETIVNHGLVTMEEAWGMASVNVVNLLDKYLDGFKENKEDRVYFALVNKRILIRSVRKNGTVVFESQ